MVLSEDNFYLKAQELWETKGNATQLDEKTNSFYYILFKKLLEKGLPKILSEIKQTYLDWYNSDVDEESKETAKAMYKIGELLKKI